MRYLFMLIATPAYSLKIHYFAACFGARGDVEWEAWGRKLFPPTRRRKYIANIWIMFLLMEICSKIAFLLARSRSACDKLFNKIFKPFYLCVRRHSTDFRLFVGERSETVGELRIKSF